jgi:hypothetical protein
MPATPMSWIDSTSLPMTSAVMRASSATGMSLVPAQTTAIRPRPRMVLSRQRRMAPECGMILDIGNGVEDELARRPCWCA